MDKIKTLIVEDDPVWMKENTKALNSERFDVVQAIDVRSALLKIEENQFELIILDLILPDSIDPITTINTFAQNAADIPIIVVSSLIDENSFLQQALSLGIQDFITKSQFSEALLIHAAKLAINRLANKFQKEPDKIIENLKNIERKLLATEMTLDLMLKKLE